MNVVKKIILVTTVVALFATAMTSCMGGKVKLKNDVDSIGYAQGVYMGRSVGSSIDQMIESSDETFDKKIVLKGVLDGMNGKDVWTQEEAEEILREYYTVTKPTNALKVSEAGLVKIESENPNVAKTESGLLYELVDGGDVTKKPVEGDKVKVVYEGKLVKNGEIFDSSKERDDTLSFDLKAGYGGVIEGWVEGLQHVGVGGTIMLWVPPHLGYGDRGQGKIGPNDALQFEVTLVEIEK